MNFKYVVIALLGGFVIMMSTLVYKSVNTDFYLVTDKYYEEGVNYDSRQAELDNVSSLQEKVSATIVEGKILIQLPTRVSEGVIVLYRPSDGTKDVIINLEVNQSLVSFETKDLDKGKWIAKMEWSDGSKMFYAEKSVFIKK